MDQLQEQSGPVTSYKLSDSVRGAEFAATMMKAWATVSTLKFVFPNREPQQAKASASLAIPRLRLGREFSSCSIRWMSAAPKCKRLS